MAEVDRTEEIVTKKPEAQEKATVGTPQKPSGITIYDEVTKQPYCIKIKNGVMVSEEGECGLTSPSTSPSTSSGNNNTDSSALPQNDSSSPSTGSGTSTIDTSTATSTTPVD